MSVRRSLIAPSEEYKRFDRLYSKFPRAARRVPPRAGDRQASRPLAHYVHTELKAIQRREHDAWSAAVVTVDEGDGMTWSAMAVERQVRDEAADFECSQITRDVRADGFPQVAAVIQQSRIVALAQSCGVSPKLAALRPRWIAFVALTVLLVGAAATAVEALSSGHHGGAFNPLYLLLGAGAAALIFLSQEMSAYLKRSEREAARKQVLDKIREAADERTQAWQQLIDALAAELAQQYGDRCVLIDGFDELDPTTRAVIERHVTQGGGRAKGRQLWVVFEDAELGTLTKNVLLGQSGDRERRHAMSRRRVQLLRLLNLSESERTQLAELAGAPGRANFRRVKWIARGHSDASEAFNRLFDGQRAAQDRDERRYGPLEVLYLLAVTSITGALDIGPRELTSQLSSKPSAPPGEVLRLLLPGATLARSEVAHAIDRLVSELGDSLDAERLAAGRLEVVGEAVEALMAQRREYRLADLGIAHLFWGLLWFTQLSGASDIEDAYRLRKLGRHLVAATPPSALGDHVSAAVATRYVAAATWTARQLLSASVPEDVPSLLELAEREASRPDQRRTLRSLCWQCYAVLGGERVLSTLLQLHTGRTSTRTQVTDLDTLFVESIGFNGSTHVSRDELARRLGSLEPDVRAYARVRALWLALTLNVPTRYGWSLFDRAASGAGERSAELVRGALERLQDSGRARAAADALTASLGTWCYAIAYRRDGGDVAHANNLLEDVRLRAYEVLDQIESRSGDPARRDFVLRAAMQELEVIAGAAAAVIQQTAGATTEDTAERQRLADHVASARGGARGISPYEAISTRMSLQSLTWVQLGYSDRNPHGFRRLASSMALRRTHFRVLSMQSDDTMENVTRALDGMSDELEAMGVTGLLAHAIATASAGPDAEIASYLMVRGYDRALASGLGSQLETDLSLVATATANPFGVSLRVFLECLMQPSRDNPARSRLHNRFLDFDDDQKTAAALWFLNAVKNDEVPLAVREGVVEELWHVAAMTDDHAREEIEGLLDIFRLSLDIQAEEPIDADETLARWEERSESRNFGFLLHLLLVSDRGNPQVIDRGLRYLEHHPESPVLSGPIHLAVDIVKSLDSEQNGRVVEREIALHYLENVRPHWEHSLPIEVNMEIVRLLLRHRFGDRRELLDRAIGLEALRQERDGLKKLPQLVAAGRFFLVVWHYYETLTAFGLRTEPPTDLGELVSMASDLQQQLFAEWTANDETVPDPVVTTDNGPVLSGDFVRYGRMLFRGSLADRRELEAAREAFNEAAADGLRSDLYDALIPAMPEPLRRLLDEHRLRLVRPTRVASRV